MKKELTERESMRNLTLSTLERTLIQNTLGANLGSDVAQYGQKGEKSANSAYENVMASKEVQDMREKQYQADKAEYKHLGVVGEPTYLSNPQTSAQIIKGLEETMETSYLEDLAEGVNKFAPELKFELPDKLKGYVHSKLIQKAAEEKDGKIMINPEKLNKDEQKAYETYGLLREAYRLTAANNVIDSNYLGNVKESLNGVMESYNPTPKSEESE